MVFNTWSKKQKAKPASSRNNRTENSGSGGRSKIHWKAHSNLGRLNQGQQETEAINIKCNAAKGNGRGTQISDDKTREPELMENRKQNAKENQEVTKRYNRINQIHTPKSAPCDL